jgi:hypothetical protein
LTYACKHHCLLPAGAAAHCSLVTFWCCYCCQLRPISYSTTTPPFGMAPHSRRASALALDETVPNECQMKCFAAGAAWSPTRFCVNTREQKILASLSSAPTGKRWVQPSSLSQRTSFLSAHGGGTSRSSRQSWQEVVEPSNRLVELQAGVLSAIKPPTTTTTTTTHTHKIISPSEVSFGAV